VKFVQTELTEPLQNAITLENVSLSLSSSSCICTGLSALSVSYLFLQCLTVSPVPSLRSLSLVSYYLFLRFFYYLFLPSFHSLISYNLSSVQLSYFLRSLSSILPLSHFILSLSSILPLSHFLLSLFRPPPLVLAFFYPSSLYLTVSLLSNSLLSSMHFFHPLPLVLMSSTLPRFLSLMAYCLFNLSHLSSLQICFISALSVVSLPQVSNSLLLSLLCLLSLLQVSNSLLFSLLSSYCLSPSTFATKKTKFKCSR